VEPPPAMTFMKPAMEPTAKRSTIFNSSSIVYSLFRLTAQAIVAGGD
jgi:hypothetical protein